MTNKEAIKLIQGIEEDGRNVNKEHIEALDLAIKALKERPHGKWIYKEFDVESGISRSYWCSNCGEPKSQWCDDFCQRCGTDMRGKEE